jgi:16S rRNA (guanine527-N7)-methyltransferase
VSARSENAAGKAAETGQAWRPPEAEVQAEAAARRASQPERAGQPPPEVAAEVFGAALGKARAFASLLATDGVTRGLIGPREASRLWDRHLLNCAVVAELLPSRGQLVDIGSGAGLPGLVLAMMCPGLDVVLVEPMLRRTSFLQECLMALDLANVTVTRARAEELAGSIQADVVTARAVAPLDRLAGWASGLLRSGGIILAIKGQSAEEEVSAARPALARLGARSTEILRVGHDKVIPATTVVRVVLAHSGGKAGKVARSGDGAGKTVGRGREEQGGAHRRRPGLA